MPHKTQIQLILKKKKWRVTLTIWTNLYTLCKKWKITVRKLIAQIISSIDSKDLILVTLMKKTSLTNK